MAKELIKILLNGNGDGSDFQKDKDTNEEKTVQK